MRPLGVKPGFAIAGLVLCLLAIAGNALNDLAILSLVGDVEAGRDEGARGRWQDVAARGALIVLVAGACGLFSVISFIVWAFGASRNVDRSQAVKGRRWGPGWAIGGWFIPVAQVFISYGVLREVWACSRMLSRPVAERSQGMRTEPSGLAFAWCLVFWTGLVVGQINRGLADAAYDSFRLRMVVWVELTSNALMITAGLLAIRLVQKVTAWQRRAMILPRADEPEGPRPASAGTY